MIASFGRMASRSLLGDKSIANDHRADAGSPFAVSNRPRQQGRVTSPAGCSTHPVATGSSPGVIQMKTTVKVDMKIDLASCLWAVASVVIFIVAT